MVVYAVITTGWLGPTPFVLRPLSRLPGGENHCIDVKNVSIHDGERIHLWQYVGGENQKWKFERL